MSEFVISGYQPASLFRYFEEICAIPRSSYHEERIADYLCDFAKVRGLFCYRDSLHNVLITRPATPGYESYEPVLLQGHTDMVCEADTDSSHDFLREGLKLYIDNGHLRARGTTLGADNGVAVASMLAVLDGIAPANVPVECLFTSQEEVGLIGAAAFDYSKIKARRMINLDAEGEGIAIASCSGGKGAVIVAQYTPVSSEGEGLFIRIGGLGGGHSGMDIHHRRANANKLMARIIDRAIQKTEINLVSFDGGSKDNAIPRECEAKIKAADTIAAITSLQLAADEIKGELQNCDSEFSFYCEPHDISADMLSIADTKRIIGLINQLPDGVFEMSADLDGLVETSSNIGRVWTDSGRITIRCSCRSSVEQRILAIMEIIDTMAREAGCRTKWDSGYPGWAFAAHSPLRELYKEHYRSLFNSEAEISAIHAGLECGIVKSAIPDMDIIAIGPNVYNVHTPREALDLASFERFWKLLAALVG